MTFEEWCRLGGYTPEYALAWIRFLNMDEWANGRSTKKITKKLADLWVAEALG